MLHVAEIEKSIRFYELLGFVLIDTDRCVPLGWARMHCDGGAIAFLRAEEEHPVDPAVQGVLLYMYTPDLTGLREQLLASGLKVPSIVYPGYMPSGELNLAIPMVTTFVSGTGENHSRKPGRNESAEKNSQLLMNRVRSVCNKQLISCAFL